MLIGCQNNLFTYQRQLLVKKLVQENLGIYVTQFTNRK